MPRPPPRSPLFPPTPLSRPPPPPSAPVPPSPPHPANDASVSMPISAVCKRILNPPQLAGLRELDFSQLTNRKPPGASNFGSPGPGRIWSCSSSILFLEQFQHSSAKSPSRRVRDSSITCTIALSVTRASFL